MILSSLSFENMSAYAGHCVYERDSFACRESKAHCPSHHSRVCCWLISHESVITRRIYVRRTMYTDKIITLFFSHGHLQQVAVMITVACVVASGIATTDDSASPCFSLGTRLMVAPSVLRTTPYSAQQKVLGQDSWARWPRSYTGGLCKILPRRPRSYTGGQDLRQDPGQDFGCHNLGTLYKILGKSWASSLVEELFVASM